MNIRIYSLKGNLPLYQISISGDFGLGSFLRLVRGHKCTVNCETDTNTHVLWYSKIKHTNISIKTSCRPQYVRYHVVGTHNHSQCMPLWVFALVTGDCFFERARKTSPISFGKLWMLANDCIHSWLVTWGRTPSHSKYNWLQVRLSRWGGRSHGSPPQFWYNGRLPFKHHSYSK